jgi:hypothetical protein
MCPTGDYVKGFRKMLTWHQTVPNGIWGISERGHFLNSTYLQRIARSCLISLSTVNQAVIGAYLVNFSLNCRKMPIIAKHWETPSVSKTSANLYIDWENQTLHCLFEIECKHLRNKFPPLPVTFVATITESFKGC